MCYTPTNFFQSYWVYKFRNIIPHTFTKELYISPQVLEKSCGVADPEEKIIPHELFFKIAVFEKYIF